MEVLDRHEKTVLMFSGGKDSVACLYLLRPYLHKITVMWLNTGNFFPENVELVHKLAADIPNFIEVKSDVESFKAQYGIPSDIVPIHNTALGLEATENHGLKIVSGYECCAHNYWNPMSNAVADFGATLIIRGQRNEEAAKSTIRSGHVENGVEYFFPIEDWTKDQVLSYLVEQDFEVPEWFHFEESSLDCINCTAFLHWMADRGEYMERVHPVEHAENLASIKAIAAIAQEQIQIMVGV